jgi:hypothetical protein
MVEVANENGRSDDALRVQPSINAPVLATLKIRLASLNALVITVSNIRLPSLNASVITDPNTRVPSLNIPAITIPNIRIRVPSLNIPAITIPNIRVPLLNNGVSIESANNLVPDEDVLNLLRHSVRKLLLIAGPVFVIEFLYIVWSVAAHKSPEARQYLLEMFTILGIALGTIPIFEKVADKCDGK